MFSSLKWFKNENLTQAIILFCPHYSEVELEKYQKNIYFYFILRA